MRRDIFQNRELPEKQTIRLGGTLQYNAPQRVQPHQTVVDQTKLLFLWFPFVHDFSSFHSLFISS